MKYRVETTRDTRVITTKLENDLRSSGKSYMPRAKPMPTMGPMSGDTSMAPMTTAVEFTLSPRQAMSIANMSIQRLVPLKSIPPSTSLRTWSIFSISFCIRNSSNILLILVSMGKI